MPKPPPAVNTGNTVRCDVSFANIVVVIEQPFSSELNASEAMRVLPRKMPCWSGNDSRIVSSLLSSATRRKRIAASFCSSDQSRCFLTKLKVASFPNRDLRQQLFGCGQMGDFLGDIGRHGSSPRGPPPPLYVDFHPVGFPALGGADAVHGRRPLNASGVRLIEEHERLAALGHLLDLLTQEPPILDDRLIRLAEMLPSTILNRSH